MCPHMASITSGRPPCHRVSTLCLSVLSHHLEMFLIETETCPALLGSRLEKGWAARWRDCIPLLLPLPPPLGGEEGMMPSCGLWAFGVVLRHVAGSTGPRRLVCHDTGALVAERGGHSKCAPSLHIFWDLFPHDYLGL